MSLDYYDVHAKEYAALTVKADMSPAYDRFLAYLPGGRGYFGCRLRQRARQFVFYEKGV